jgi:hypothetical protein
MSNGRVITRPGQLDELRHGHRTALRPSADDSPGDVRLDHPARTAKRAGSRSPSTPELDDLQRTGRPISDCSSLGATRQLMPPVLELRGPAAGRPSRLARLLGADARALDGGPTGFPDRMKTSYAAGSSPRCRSLVKAITRTDPSLSTSGRRRLPLPVIRETSLTCR